MKRHENANTEHQADAVLAINADIIQWKDEKPVTSSYQFESDCWLKE